MAENEKLHKPQPPKFPSRLAVPQGAPKKQGRGELISNWRPAELAYRRGDGQFRMKAACLRPKTFSETPPLISLHVEVRWGTTSAQNLLPRRNSLRIFH